MTMRRASVLLERIGYAVELYIQDQVTLSRAAEIAGMSIWQFRDHLRAKGLEVVVPEETPEDLETMIDSFKQSELR